MIYRYGLLVCIIALGVGPLSLEAQVVETTPSPARTDQSVTITFYADRGSAGLENHDGEVYAHTGISTDQNGNQEWKCVKNHWPTSDSFTGNRSDTKLTEVGDDQYELEIEDIRAYYQDTSTSCSLAEDERIQTMNFVFRNADGTKEGKAEGGQDIFVDVNDVGDGPFVAVNLLNPSADPPLYPFLTAKDTTVEVTVTVDTANVDGLSELRLLVDGTEAASTTNDSLTYELSLSAPNRFDIWAEAEATVDGSPLRDTLDTFLIRTPDVTEEARPSGVEDGINYDSGDPSRVTLSLNAPNKDFVYAIGDFSDWEIDNQYFMKRDGDHWWVTLDLSTSQQYDFQYFVDGEIRTFDPFAHKVRSPQDDGISEDVYPGLQSYPGDKTENLVSVIRPGAQQNSFAFSDFQPPPREDLVIYELLLRDFVDQSSFDVLADTLDYLDRLGVNAVELMPVANFGGNNSWGYNPNAHLALDKSYGPPEDFKQFVEAAHNRGIAVIMDVVYNHVTDQSPLVQLYGGSANNPFIINSDRDRGFCDDFFRELDQGSLFIQNYIDRANEYWIEEFNVDGFRFDLAKCVADDGVNINDSGHSDAVTAGWKEVSDHVWETVDPDTYMILEFFGDPSIENELGGYRASETGSMMTWHNMNRPYSEADMGYVGGSSDFGSGLSESYFGNRSMYEQASYIPYMESHDEQWLMRRKKAFGNESEGYSTKDLETALNRQKLVGAFYFTVPGPRMMWQFGELGYGWGENECLRESDACTANDPGRTAPKPIRWAYRDPQQHPDRVRLYKTWSTLINLREAHEVFRSLETEVEMQVGDGDRIRWIRLSHPSMDAIVVGNFGLLHRNATVTFPQAGTWHNVFAKQAVEVQNTTQTIPLRPGEFRVYTSSEPAVTPEDGLVPSTVTPPDRIPVSVSQSFGPVTEQSSYRLVALPGGSSIPLTEALGGTPNSWRAFHDTGAESDYLVEYSPSDDRFALGGGRGLWVLSEQSFAYQDSVAHVALQNSRAHIPLHDGWNIISNPLSFSVDWDRVRGDNGISAPLHRWNGGSFTTADTFRTAGAGEAFYFNNAAGLDSLAVPYPGSIADRQAAQATLPAAVNGVREASTFRLQAQVDSTASTVRLGYRDDGPEVQHAAPRAPFSTVQLVAGSDADAFATQVRSLASDSVSSDRLSFALRLSAEPGTPVTLRAKGLDSVTDSPVTLVNQQTGATHTLRAGESVRVTSSAPTTRLQLRLGPAQDETSLTPKKVRLHPNYPNPFREATTIEYDVPTTKSVRLSVFDVLGRRVETLVQGERSPGRHTVTWKPGETGRGLSSGIYFLRLKAGGTVRTRRISLVR